ncbi:PHB depolymerase family esterase [Duganella sp. Leaf126]|uniref:extracellular catalytic domain type 1 short-chain-length polyhydroxyalkanoate depolymerase n=1 Tax=Duganella sp. Leaf126 TaxID=1736266 RepID=UPI000B07032C|nr:PHB depolymerase family esterase [Duganella sp. Leaf126]
MKKAAGLFRSLMRTSIRTARQGAAVNKLVTAMLTPAPAPKRKAAAPRKPAASAASAAAAPGKWLTSHVESANARRVRFWLYLPQHMPEETIAQGLPLIVMLHGCHQTATQFAEGTRMNQWAERKGYAVLYPQQLVSNQAQRCWKWYDRATQEGGGDVPTIVAMIDKVAGAYAIDRSRIYVAGISAGAGMAHILALNHPQLFAAVGLHSGPVFGAGHSTVGALGVMQHGAASRAELAVEEVLARHTRFPGMPTILVQGEGDSVVRPINQLQLARQALALNGLAPGTPARITHKAQGSTSRHRAHRIDDYYAGRKLLLRVARIDALEHAWSGGDPALKFNDRAGPDATRMMLEFFARHRRQPG